MNRWFARCLVWLGLAAYATVSTVGPWLHALPGAAHDTACHECACGGEPAHGEDAQHADEADHFAATMGRASAQSDRGVCLLCEFLAAAKLVVDRVAVDAGSAAIEPVAATPPCIIARGALSGLGARGPPLADPIA